MVASVADANAALRHIGMCDWIAVGCEGDLSKKGRICLIQVLAVLCQSSVSLVLVTTCSDMHSSFYSYVFFALW